MSMKVDNYHVEMTGVLRFKDSSSGETFEVIPVLVLRYAANQVVTGGHVEYSVPLSGVKCPYRI